MENEDTLDMQPEDEIFALACDYVRGGEEDIRAEDVLGALGAALGEMTLVTAGLYEGGEHGHVAGAPREDHVKTEAVLSGGKTRLAEVPATSVFGLLRDGLPAIGYKTEDLPDPGTLYQAAAQREQASSPDDMDWRTLDVPEENQLDLPPFMAAFDLRSDVYDILDEYDVEPEDAPKVMVQACLAALNAVRDVIEPAIALRILVATAVEISRLWPMTDEAMQELLDDALADIDDDEDNGEGQTRQ